MHCKKLFICSRMLEVSELSFLFEIWTGFMLRKNYTVYTGSETNKQVCILILNGSEIVENWWNMNISLWREWQIVMICLPVLGTSLLMLTRKPSHAFCFISFMQPVDLLLSYHHCYMVIMSIIKPLKTWAF